jgi:hypothetical protein
MEPNNIEKQISEKLNAREIQPSAQAWDRLDAMLSVQEKASTKTSFPWLKIAAGFVLLVGISFLFLNQNNTNEVFVPVNSNASMVEKTETSSIKETLETPVASKNDVNTKSEKLQQKENKTGARKSIQNFSQSQNIATLSKKENMPNNKSVVVKAETEISINKTKDEIQDKPSIVQESKTIVAENKQQVPSKLKIDASSLLNQVEGEVTLSFRQKVMKSISKNYKDAKESFVSRNQE